MKALHKISESILYYLSNKWPDNIATRNKPDFKKLSKNERNYRYALDVQFKSKVKTGVQHEFIDKNILEIGCGHGGISLFYAVNGAREVTGIDINSESLAAANEFVNKFSKKQFNGKPKVSFVKADATALPFEDKSFDLILAENVFEHFNEYEKVIQECYRVLSNNGRLIVPIFSSIHSKYAYHVKTIMKLPWIQWFFSDKTIINVLKRKATIDPYIYDIYPGLKDNPKKIVDIRKHKDLNHITHKLFKETALKSGFLIEKFEPVSARDIKLLRILIQRIPFLRNSIFADIFSTGAKSILKKQIN